MPPTICATCGYPMDGTCPNGCAQRKGFGARFRRTPDNPVYRTGRWRRLRERVIGEWVARHGWVCPGWRRQQHPVPTGGLTLDHAQPLVLGGAAYDPSNVGPLCSSCQARKSLSQRVRPSKSRR